MHGHPDTVVHAAAGDQRHRVLRAGVAAEHRHGRERVPPLHHRPGHRLLRRDVHLSLFAADRFGRRTLLLAGGAQMLDRLRGAHRRDHGGQTHSTVHLKVLYLLFTE